MDNKALNYLSLARKAGRAELGEEPVGDVSRTGKAYVIAVASDASDHTWRRAKSYAAGTEQQCVRLPFTKDELGQAVTIGEDGSITIGGAGVSVKLVGNVTINGSAV